jgi:hypothetical protein
VTFESPAERDEFLAALHKLDKPRATPPAATTAAAEPPATHDFAPGQHVRVNLMGLSAGSVQFSQNVESVYATILSRSPGDAPAYRVKLLISFHGVSELDVPADRVRPA